MTAPSAQLLRALRNIISQPGSKIPRHVFNTKHLRDSRHSLMRSLQLPQCARLSTASYLQSRPPPKSRDRGPSSSEDTQTDFGSLNVLGNTPPPTTSIDACLSDGFHFGNGMKIVGGSGCLLIAGEAFTWRPWETGKLGRAGMINKKGQWEVGREAWGILDLVWPKPGKTSLSTSQVRS